MKLSIEFVSKLLKYLWHFVKEILCLESSNKKNGPCILYVIFSRYSFLYYFAEVYIHEKLEVKQNETSKNLAPHQEGLGCIAIKKQKVLEEYFSGSTAYEKQVSSASEILQLG